MVTQAKIPCHAYSITKTYLIMFNKFVIELIWMKNYKAHNIRYLICINEVKLPLNMHILTNWKHMIATFPSLGYIQTRADCTYKIVQSGTTHAYEGLLQPIRALAILVFHAGKIGQTFSLQTLFTKFSVISSFNWAISNYKYYETSLTWLDYYWLLKENTTFKT